MSRPGPRIALMYGLLALGSALAPAPPEPTNNLKALADARYKAARKLVEVYERSLIAPPTVEESEDLALWSRHSLSLMEQDHLWSERAMDARLDRDDQEADRLAAIEEHLRLARKLDDVARRMAEDEKRDVSFVQVMKFEYYRLQAEYRLAEEESKSK